MENDARYENPHLHWIFASLRAYRAGWLDLRGLVSNLYGEVMAMEGDVPKPVREALERLMNELDVVYWTSDKATDAERVIAEAEIILDRYYPQRESPDTPQ